MFYRGRAKNSIIYPCSENEGSKTHEYLIETEEQIKNVYQIGHLYLADRKRLSLVKKGLALKIKFSDKEVPQILRKGQYTKNICTNSPLTIEDFDKVEKLSIDENDAEEIIKILKI